MAKEPQKYPFQQFLEGLGEIARQQQLKHQEGEPPQTNPPLPEPVKKVFIEAERIFPNDFAKQAELIVASHRPPSLSEDFQPRMQDFSQYIRDQQRREREAAEQQRREQRAQELSRQERERQEKARIERKRERELLRGQESCRQLKREVESRGINLLEQAEGIKREIWKQGVRGFFTPVHIREVSEPDVILNEDGTVKTDYSRYGVEISYNYYKDVRNNYEIDKGRSVRMERRKMGLQFGVRFSGGSEKSLFVEGHDFPITPNTDYLQRFNAELYRSANRLNPRATRR